MKILGVIVIVSLVISALGKLNHWYVIKIIKLSKTNIFVMKIYMQ